jgi:hypothetical protein
MSQRPARNLTIRHGTVHRHRSMVATPINPGPERNGRGVSLGTRQGKQPHRSDPRSRLLPSRNHLVRGASSVWSQDCPRVAVKDQNVDRSPSGRHPENHHCADRGKHRCRPPQNEATNAKARMPDDSARLVLDADRTTGTEARPTENTSSWERGHRAQPY